jgi:hypothetical protein
MKTTTAGARRVVWLAAGALIAACSSAPTDAPADGELPIGTWGGDSAGMIVGDTSMHLHVGCTFGDVSGRIKVGADGSFDVAGNYTLHAFPIQVGPTDPARFTGKVIGATATVTATVDDTAQHTTVVHGPVIVSLGVTPRLGPCPICARPVMTKSRSARLEARVSRFLQATTQAIKRLAGGQ